jgi:hypothetical protein
MQVVADGNKKYNLMCETRNSDLFYMYMYVCTNMTGDTPRFFDFLIFNQIH